MIPARCWETAPCSVRSSPIPLPPSFPLLPTVGPPASAGRSQAAPKLHPNKPIVCCCHLAVIYFTPSAPNPWNTLQKWMDTEWRSPRLLTVPLLWVIQNDLLINSFLSVTHPPPEHLCYFVLSPVRLFVTSWTVESMEFSRPESWSG